MERHDMLMIIGNVYLAASLLPQPNAWLGTCLLLLGLVYILFWFKMDGESLARLKQRSAELDELLEEARAHVERFEPQRQGLTPTETTKH